MTPSGRKVVLVDDVAANRHVLGTWLRRAGYTVLEGGTGAEALALVDAHTDVVVLDVNLPDVSGLEVCRRLRFAESTAAVPVLHVSATTVDVRSRTSALDGGADAYLTEPLDREEFLATVRALWRSQEARRDAATRAGRLARLAAVTVTMNAARTSGGLLEAAASGLAEILGRPVLAVSVAPDGMANRVLCPGPGRTCLTGRVSTALPTPPPVPQVFAADELSPLWVELFDRAGLPGRAWFATPYRDDPTTGGLVVSLAPGEDDLPAEDRELVQSVLHAAEVAVRNLRTFSEEHHIALTLQRAMLPTTMPTVPGLRLAARYAASEEQMSVGGDFYDVVPLPDARVAVVIGDVQGHSLRAATVMAELRFTLRAYLAEGHDTATAVGLVNDVLLGSAHPELVSLCVLVLDLATGRFERVNAGHLPSVLRSPDGTVLLPATHTLLGVPAPRPFASVPDVLGPGGVLVLVTDGLLERRDGRLESSLERLRTLVADAGTDDPDALCDLLLQSFATESADDDVAVLVVARPR